MIEHDAMVENEVSTSSWWNCHDHRDELVVSDGCTVCHPDKGQLCASEKHWDVVWFHPIVFKDKRSAQRWIESGTIAELQESFSHLGIGFSSVMFKRRLGVFGGVWE